MKITSVVKREGDVVDYDREKVTMAIFKAAHAVGGTNKKEAEKLATKVEQFLIKNDQIHVNQLDILTGGTVWQPPQLPSKVVPPYLFLALGIGTGPKQLSPWWLGDCSI